MIQSNPLSLVLLLFVPNDRLLQWHETVLESETGVRYVCLTLRKPVGV